MKIWEHLLGFAVILKYEVCNFYSSPTKGNKDKDTFFSTMLEYQYSTSVHTGLTQTFPVI